MNIIKLRKKARRMHARAFAVWNRIDDGNLNRLPTEDEIFVALIQQKVEKKRNNKEKLRGFLVIGVTGPLNESASFPLALPKSCKKKIDIDSMCYIEEIGRKCFYTGFTFKKLSRLPVSNNLEEGYKKFIERRRNEEREESFD